MANIASNSAPGTNILRLLNVFSEQRSHICSLISLIQSLGISKRGVPITQEIHDLTISRSPRFAKNGTNRRKNYLTVRALVTDFLIPRPQTVHLGPYAGNDVRRILQYPRSLG